MIKIEINKFLIFVVAITLTEITHNVISGEALSLTSCIVSLAASIILSLSWLIGKMKLQKLHIFALIWLNLYIVRFFSNMIEGYFFTTIFDSPSDFIISALIPLGFTLIEAAFAGALLSSGG